MLITILSLAIVLGVLIFVHELGHFLTARMVGIEVERFSIGFGPRILGFRRGETEYVISLLPFGGYVKMAGMEEMEPIEGKSTVHADASAAGSSAGSAVLSQTTSPTAPPASTGHPADSGPRPGTFDSKSVPARALVLSAGVIMNILFAIAVYAASAFIWGVPVEPEARVPAGVASVLPTEAAAMANVPSGTRITAVGGTAIADWGDLRNALLTATPGPVDLHFEEGAPVTIEIPAADSLRILMVRAFEPGRELVIGEVLDGSPAARAGLVPGDLITAIGGKPVTIWPELVAAIEARPGEAVEIELIRDGNPMTLQVVPRAEIVATPDGGERVVGKIGVGEAPPKPLPRQEIGIAGALAHGVEQSWAAAKMIVKVLGDMVTGKLSVRSLGGPILVGQLSGQVARIGLEPFLAFMALFSINLAVLNLLPIPVLDGGHLALLGVEAVRGRALSVEVRARLMQLGFVIVLAIMALAVGNDILRLFGL